MLLLKTNIEIKKKKNLDDENNNYRRRIDIRKRTDQLTMTRQRVDDDYRFDI